MHNERRIAHCTHRLSGNKCFGDKHTELANHFHVTAVRIASRHDGSVAAVVCCTVHKRFYGLLISGFDLVFASQQERAAVCAQI